MVAAVYAAFWLLATVWPVGIAPQEHAHPATKPRVDRASDAGCGPVGLFLLLRAHGHPVSYAEVVEAFGSGNHAVTTLAEIVQAARRLGVIVEVTRCSPADTLRRAPALCYIGGREGEAGHLVLITRRGDGSVRIFDPAGAVTTVPPRLVRGGTEQVICLTIAQPARPYVTALMAWVIVFFLCLIGTCSGRLLRRRTPTSPP